MATSSSQLLTALLVSLTSDPVLVPNACVAEIVPIPEVEPGRRRGRAWLLGQIDWRGVKVPLISLEGLCGWGVPPYSADTRIAVFYTVSGEGKVPYFAVIVQGIPRLVRLYPETLSETASAQMTCPYMAQTASLEGNPVLLPNLLSIEQTLVHELGTSYA